MEKLNVAVADDNERMVEVLGQIIEEDKDLELVGKAHIFFVFHANPKRSDNYIVRRSAHPKRSVFIYSNI